MNPASLGLIIYLFVVFVAAILGNGLVLLVRFYRSKRGHLTAYEVLICHLALVDLMNSLNIPIYIDQVLKRKWDFGLVSCKFIRTLESVTLYVSILNVVIMAYERFRSIQNPLSKRWSHCKTAIVLLCAWLWSFLSFIPYTIKLNVGAGYCTTEKSTKTFNQVFIMSQFIIGYLLPLIIISIFNMGIVFVLRQRARAIESPEATEMTIATTSFRSTQPENQSTRSNSLGRNNTINMQTAGVSFTRQYRTVARVLVAFTIKFTIFCLPHHVYHIRHEFGDKNKTYGTTADLVFRILGYMIYLNSCVNPFIYSIIDQRFRKDVKDFFLAILS